MILMIDDKGAIFTAKLNDVTIFNPNIEIEKDTNKIELEIDTFENLFDNYVSNSVLTKISDKEEFYKPYKKEKQIPETYVKDVLNTMILSVLPDGETLTKENAPSLVDIINPTKHKDKGTLENTIEVIDNDIAHNGYLYTYGSYFYFKGVKYLCERKGESAGNTVKLYYTPDQLIGHYFTVV